jgi:hypothetical protein
MFIKNYQIKLSDSQHHNLYQLTQIVIAIVPTFAWFIKLEDNVMMTYTRSVIYDINAHVYWHRDLYL